MVADKLRIICGPTAAGKSSLALDVANANNAAIISADSRQIYKNFDIGTAKPSRAERETVPHFGIDIVEATERYSAARWAADAHTWLKTAQKTGRKALLVGGTGLYLKALVEPLFNAPEVEAHRRQELEAELDALSLEELRRWCGELDPPRSHLGRTQLRRTIETALLSGQRISVLHEQQAHQEKQKPAFEAHYLVVDPGDTLRSQIEARVDDMLDRGWDREVRELARNTPANAPAWKSSGYRTVLAYVNGEIDLSSARERIIIETRQYAKRQRTWFRHQLPSSRVARLNPNQPDAAEILSNWWESSE